MITAVRYAEITGDNTTAGTAVDARVAEAVDLLEDYLDRPLPEAEYTEQLPADRDGRLWPRAVPLIEAEGYTIDGLALAGTTPFPSFLDPVDTIAVTYTGGWADPTAEGYDPEAPHPNRLPPRVERDLAWAVYRLLRPQAPSVSVPANATAVRLGDASVSYGKGGAGAAQGNTDAWWSKRTRAYRYDRVGAPVGSR